MADADDIRRMALSLPQVVEQDHHRLPSFRVGGKIFCTLRRDPPRLMVKLDGEDQRNLCEAYPALIEPVPGYWGRKGSTFVAYDSLGEALIGSLLRLAWSGVAPRRLRPPG